MQKQRVDFREIQVDRDRELELRPVDFDIQFKNYGNLRT